jgi:Domain of unknown function (DUF4249)
MKKFSYAFALLMTFLSLGCDQIVDIDLPEVKPQLVVNLIFNTDSIWMARVTLSQNLDEPYSPIAAPGTKVLIEENGQVIDSLRQIQGDTFVSAGNLKPVPGRTYTVRASAPGYADVAGTETVPFPIGPTAASWRDSTSIDQFGQVTGEFKFAIDDPAGTHNYYMLSVVTRDTIIYWNQVYSQSQDPQLVYNWRCSGHLIDDATFDGRSREFVLPIYSYTNDPMVRRDYFFILNTITESLYLYLETSVDYDNASGNPFAEPVRVYSNMPGGMGIFGGYSPRVILSK